MGLFSWGKKSAPIMPPPAPPEVPAGQRIYAVGDVHGRFDLLQRLLRQVEADDAARGPADTHVVMLGDLIDRGPQSREIVEFFLERTPKFAQFHFIMGNHEEMLLQLMIDPEPDAMLQYLRYGGRELFESYGAPRTVLDASDDFMPDALPSYVPPAHRDFLQSMHDGMQFGDYFFTHAGIRPGVPLAQQTRQDLRWIRADFLESRDHHGAVVVHGHTVADAAEVLPNRIGIDTGAYMTGQLTALGLQGTDQWLLQTRGSDVVTLPAGGRA